MNERIKELAERATKHYPAIESSGEFWTFDKEKFAELIVRECAAVANINSHQWQVPGDFVLKHFGVEE